MKTSIKIFACLSVAAALCSCNEKATYTTNPFIRFDGASYAVSEDAGTVSIPVYAYNKTGNDIAIPRAKGGPANATFSIINGKAEKDVDFTVSPANGVLTFDNEGIAYIEVSVVDQAGVYTGNLDFSIELTSAGDGYTLASETCCYSKVTIKDLDHPLAAILGTYTVTNYYYNDGIYQGSYTTELVPVDGDIHAVCCMGINKMANDNGIGVIGTVSDDMKTISFAPQPVDFSTGNGEMWMFSSDLTDDAQSEIGFFIFDEEDIVFTSSEEGVFKSPQAAAFVDDYVWPSYGGFGIGQRIGKSIGADLNTVWVKQ